MHYTQAVLLTHFQNTTGEKKNLTSGLLNSSLWTRKRRLLEVAGDRLSLLDKWQVRELQIYFFTVQKDFALLKQLEWGISFGQRLQSFTWLYWAVCLMVGFSKLWHKMTVLQRHKKLIAFVICRLLQPLEQALPGRGHYMSGLKYLARRIHSTTRLKPYSKIKVDTDFRTARALTWFMVVIPWVKMIKDTHKEMGRESYQNQ